jgi:diacylglycerol kinase (ATP)
VRVNLIYNESAGQSRPSLAELQAALEAIGYYPVYRATASEADLDPILADVEGLVVSAGGDGTARAVITRLLGKEAPLLILPMGTANNIATTLGIDRPPLELIAGLANPQYRYLDVGEVHAPWGVDYFIEGAGFGFFADLLSTYDPEKGKSIIRSLQAMTETLQQGNSYANTLLLNGEALPGDYLLVEILNTTAVGPRLKFAPQADPTDGLLDLVSIQASDQAGFLAYLTSLLTEDLASLSTVTTRQVRELSFAWEGFALHVDGEVRPTPEFAPLSGAASGLITVKIRPQAIRLCLPEWAATAEGEES